jgi:hypothetical protein
MSCDTTLDKDESTTQRHVFVQFVIKIVIDLQTKYPFLTTKSKHIFLCNESTKLNKYFCPHT